MLRNRTSLACLLAVLFWSGSALAQNFPLSPGFSAPGVPKNGGGLQIGTGLPLPVGPSGIFTKGKIVTEAGIYPPALVNTAAGPQIVNYVGAVLNVPAGVITNMIGGAPRPIIGVFPTNAGVFQVRTSINYAWPSAAAAFAPGGAPANGSTFSPPPGGPTYSITYSGSVAAFGGAAQFALTTGPFAGTILLPPNGLGVKPIASVWINNGAKAPGAATMALIAGASNMLGLGAPGQALAGLSASTAFGNGGRAVGPGVPTPPNPNPFLVFGGIGNGTIVGSVPSFPGVPPAPSNMVVFTKGYPWVTGLITVKAPAGGVGNPKETFYLSGNDGRVAGVGNLSMVSGALSLRALSGPNANRGWVTLTIPEPTAALGAVGALAMLGLCHGLVRRR